MTKTNDKLDEILSDFCDASCRINAATADGFGDYHTCRIPEAKQAIEALIKEKEVLAKIEELNSFIGESRPHWKQVKSHLKLGEFMHAYRGNFYPTCIVCGFCPGAMQARLDDRIAELNKEKTK